ncbi:MAG: hypothetical protein ACO1RX_16705 [Candidatus Sericytochromatia bacterium]
MKTHTIPSQKPVHCIELDCLCENHFVYENKALFFELGHDYVTIENVSFHTTLNEWCYSRIAFFDQISPKDYQVRDVSGIDFAALKPVALQMIQQIPQTSMGMHLVTFIKDRFLPYQAREKRIGIEEHAFFNMLNHFDWNLHMRIEESGAIYSPDHKLIAQAQAYLRRVPHHLSCLNDSQGQKTVESGFDSNSKRYSP